MVVIFTNFSTVFSLSPELEKSVFNIDGIAYCLPRTPSDREFLERVKKFCYERIYEAIDGNYSIIIINTTPLTLEVMKELHEKTDKPNAADWLILSFFHDDPEITDNKIQVTETEYLNPQVLTDEKTKDMERLAEYPFVKKVIIPYGGEITADYLKSRK
jgi:hypothetical protein